MDHRLEEQRLDGHPIEGHPMEGKPSLNELFEISASRHSHLCPRQILGVRAGLVAVAWLGLDVPRTDKHLLAILETDGCFADGVEAATGCAVGHRTLRIEDYGKIALTLVDVKAERAVRVAACPEVRQRAYDYAPNEKRHYFAQLAAYQVMPDEEMFSVQTVRLNRPVKEIVSRAGVRVNCQQCGEEIINEREVWRGGKAFCLACAGPAYFSPVYAFPGRVRLSKKAMLYK